MWKIVVIIGESKLTYTVTDFKEREGRILFIDRLTGKACNYPIDSCFIEGGV